MRFLDDPALYRRTEHCLRFLRGLPAGPREPPGARPERYHLYWRGAFTRKHAFAVKSFLATQDVAASELWLWLDAEVGYDGHAENPSLRPLLPFVQVKRYDPAVEARDTPLEDRPQLYAPRGLALRSDAFRHLVLYRYGGTYADLDVMFLRDLGPLRAPPFADEFCYHWSFGQPRANTAVMRLQRASATGWDLLERCRELDTCHPKVVLDFRATHDLGLLVLPCVFFDPLWLHADRRDRYAAAPFRRFPDFFRPFGWWFGPRGGVASFRDFLPGAFTYHWHNCWDAPEVERSYFGLFDRELDEVLRERLPGWGQGCG